MVTLTQAQKDYQLAHPEETSTKGFAEFIIIGLCIIEVCVALRLWTRKLQKIPWHSDDYILIVAATIAIGYAVTAIYGLKYGFGHHTLTIPKERYGVRGKSSYANNLFYTTMFPLSRISLVLLYKRVFIKPWFQYACWILIAAYAGYSISTVFVDAFGILPVRAVWDSTVKVQHAIDGSKLVFGNTVFNIITDIFLLILPLSIIWTLHMSRMNKLGVTFVFCLGCLTLIASIVRCYYSFHYDLGDPDYTTGRAAFWTVTEVYLGLLCPCLVTFQPIFWRSYRFVSSHLSPSNRNRLNRVTGVPDSDNPSGYNARTHTELKPVSSLESDSTKNLRSVHSRPSDVEAQLYTINHYHKSDFEAPPVPTEDFNEKSFDNSHGRHLSGNSGTMQAKHQDGMVVDQGAALANLDPRVKSNAVSSTAHASVDDKKRQGAPDQGIGVQKEWRLESTSGRGL